MTRNKLYFLLSTACTFGYIWLTITIIRHTSGRPGLEVCLFKHLTTIPCPSCGSIRSILALLNGNIADSLYWNPFGLIIFTILVASPVWIIYDMITQKASLFRFYLKTEHFLNQKRVAIPALILVLVNWIWNIYKGV
jgi:Protein of unknown function (DUF2752)